MELIFFFFVFLAPVYVAGILWFQLRTGRIFTYWPLHNVKWTRKETPGIYWAFIISQIIFIPFPWLMLYFVFMPGH